MQKPNIVIQICLFALASMSTPVLAGPAVQEAALSFGPAAAAQFTLARPGGPDVHYTISKPAQKMPLVLFIQGSGCVPPFVGLGTAHRYSTVFNYLPLAAQGKYAVMVVDKPYAPTVPPPGEPGVATACPAEFNAYFSYDSWLATLQAALRHALALPYVDATRVLLIGASEGAPMAAGLARALPQVTHVALLGATGTTQLFDFAANIYRAGGSDEDTARRLQALDATVDAINAEPESTSKFAWGHTYLRWSSFFARAPGEDLLQSKARVYLVSGMQDNSVPILSTEVAYARLRALGRDVAFHRVPQAGHALIEQKEYDAIMTWFDRR